MMTLPLAIYTANHGLEWTYPKQEIGFAELDSCRTALAPLPDFDMGEAGYEGVWVTAERVFAVVCQSAPKWDFRGRDATYLAVTWMSREEAKGVDFEVLLSHPALRTPTKNPPSFIEVHQTPFRSCPIQELSTVLPSFQSVDALISALPMNQTAKIKRILNMSSVTCRYETIGSTESPQRTVSPVFSLPEQPPVPSVPREVSNPTRLTPAPSLMSMILLIFTLILLGFSLLLNLYLGWEWLNQRPELKRNVQETIEMQVPPGQLKQTIYSVKEALFQKKHTTTNEINTIGQPLFETSLNEEGFPAALSVTNGATVIKAVDITTETTEEKR